jgi:hypothetical protein
LKLEIIEIGAQNGEVIGVGSGGKVILVILRLVQAAKLVPPASHLQPTQEGFHENEEQEG